jgi:hypothetical protein
MSQVALSGNVSGTGTFTIASPNSNTDRTLNLPDASGTILTTATPGVPVNGPTFSAIAGSATALSAGTSTKVNFSSEQWDTANCYDTGTSRFTPNVAGYYQISGTVRTDITNNPVLHIYVRKNGSDVFTGSFLSVSSSQTATTVSGLVFCNGTTDFIDITVFSGSAGNTNTGIACTFQGALIRGA